MQQHVVLLFFFESDDLRCWGRKGEARQALTRHFQVTPPPPWPRNVPAQWLIYELSGVARKPAFFRQEHRCCTFSHSFLVDFYKKVFTLEHRDLIHGDPITCHPAGIAEVPTPASDLLNSIFLNHSILCISILLYGNNRDMNERRKKSFY